MTHRELVRVSVAVLLGGAIAFCFSLAPSYGQEPVKETREKIAERVYVRLQDITAQVFATPPAGIDSIWESIDATRAERLYLWSRRWMEASRDSSTTKEQRIEALRDHLARMKGWEEASPVKDAFKEVGHPAPNFETSPEWTGSEFATSMKYFRMEAEAWLAEAVKS